jgi:predicted Zn-dependent protease
MRSIKQLGRIATVSFGLAALVTGLSPAIAAGPRIPSIPGIKIPPTPQPQQPPPPQQQQPQQKQSQQPTTLAEQITVTTNRYGGELRPVSVTEAVMNVADKLAPGGNYHIHLLNSPEVNHFLLPEKHIFITRGLLENLDNDAQLAAVLGIDIGHDQNQSIQHMEDAAKKDASKNVWKNAINANNGRISINPGGAATNWMNVTMTPTGDFGGQFTPEDELAATKLALKMMAKANYDPYQMAEYVTLMNEKLPAPKPGANAKDVRFTHPSGNEWALNVRAEVKSEFPNPDPNWQVATDSYVTSVLTPLKPAAPAGTANAPTPPRSPDSVAVPAAGTVPAEHK